MVARRIAVGYAVRVAINARCQLLLVVAKEMKKQDLSIATNWKSRTCQFLLTEKAEYALTTPLQQAIDNVRSDRSHVA